MNFSDNNQNYTLYSTNNNIYNLIIDIIGYYVIPLVSLIGIILNSLLGFILKNNDLKHGLYKYIFVKSVIDIVVCVLGSIYIKTLCFRCGNYEYERQFYAWYIVIINIRIVFTMSSISEIYLILNRYLILKNIRNCFFDVKLRYLVPFIIIVPIVLYLPIYLSIELTSEGNEIYTNSWTGFGKTSIFKFYTLIILVPEIFIPVFSLIILSILTIRAYNKRMCNQAEFMTTSIRHLKRLEMRHTRITVVLTILFVFSRMVDSCASILVRFSYFDTFFLEITILNMLRQFTLLISFCMHALSNVLIIVPMDKNLLKIFKELLTNLKKVIMN